MGKLGQGGGIAAGLETVGKLYEVKELLQHSPGAATFSGEDRLTHSPVLIKIAKRAAASAMTVRKIEKKVNYLRQLKSPYMVVPSDYGFERDYFFVVRPFVEGESLAERLARGPLSISDTILLGKCLMASLAEAHEHQVLHQDIKPTNLILEGKTSLTKVRLVDSTILRALPSARGGNFYYLSPEQAGLLPHPVDPRSDLYSAGVVLYECLEGAPPFTESDLGTLLRKHLSVIPESLLKKNPELPRALDNIVQHLLRKDLKDRYQSARAVWHDLEMLEQSRNRGETNPVLSIGSRDRRQVLTDPNFVGRERELQSLQEAFEAAGQGRGGLLLVEAESGGGKTRLLEEFARSIAASGAWVACGQALDQSAQQPFQLMVGVAETFTREIRENDVLLSRLKSSLADHAHTLATALPEFKILSPDPVVIPTAPEHYAEMRTLEAFCHLLEGMGEANRPVVLLLDDCQWGDSSTLKLLNHWNERRKLSRESCYVFIVAAYRSDEVPSGHLLRTMSEVPRLKFVPLNSQEIKELVRSMAGEIPSEAGDLVVSLSAGSPFMATAILRGLVESAALSQETSGWQVNPEGIKRLQASHQSSNFLARRLELLNPETRNLLGAGALLGKRFELEIAAHLADMSLSLAIQLVQEACDRHILWHDSETAEYAFSHDKLRESLLGQLPAEERKRLHRLAAEHLQKMPGSRSLELAYHFDAAEEYESAFPYAHEAGKQARAQHSLEVCEQQYRIALRGVSGKFAPRRSEIVEGLGDVLLLRGDYEEAERQFQSILDLAVAAQDRSRLLGKLGDAAFKKGNVAQASEFIERALEGLNSRVPRSSGLLLLGLSWELGIQALHTLFPKLFRGHRARLQESDVSMVRIRLLSRLAYVYWFQKGKIACAWAHLREMNLAERHPDSLELAQAYSEHAPVCTMVPYFSRAIEYAERSYRIRESFNDRWGQGQSLHFHGVALYAASRFEEAIEKCEEAALLLEKTGDRWEVNTANWHIGFCLYRLGRIKEASEKFKMVYHSGVAIGDHQAAAISLSGWAKASGGEAPADLIEQERRRLTGDRHTQFELTQGHAVRLLRDGRYETAATVLRQSRDLYVTVGFQSEYIAPISAWLATALRKQIEFAKGGYTPRKLSAMLQELKRSCRQAVRMGQKYQNNLPHALRERAIYHAFMGDRTAAFADLERSVAVATAQGAKAELAQTLSVRGKLGVELGQREAEEDLLTAQSLLEECQVPPTMYQFGEKQHLEERVTLSLIDRFENVVDIGRKLAASLTADDIYENVRLAAENLLRGERCQVFRWEEEKGKVSCLSNDPTFPYSETLIESAFNERKAVVSAEGMVNASEPGVGSSTRSAICAPIFVRGKRAGCFYVVHSRIGALYGPLESRLADFIATLAGAALENAQGIDQLHRLNQDLAEKMVAQKKAEAELHRYALQLERSNSDLEQFAYVASHDLKEPLRMVTNYVRLLGEQYKDRLDKEADEYIGFAEEGAKRMYSLIEALLGYSRVTKPDENKVEVNFNDCLSKAVTNLQQAIDETQAVIKTVDLPVLPGNPTQILQLFQNLISNALKFRKPGVPQIEILAAKRPGCWQFGVRDQGIGIESKYLEKIFIIFHRLHHRETYPGTGIGLAICKKIVLQHGGNIWVESTPGEGSTFYFTIPNARAGQLKEESDESTVSHTAGGR